MERKEEGEGDEEWNRVLQHTKNEVMKLCLEYFIVYVLWVYKKVHQEFKINFSASAWVGFLRKFNCKNIFIYGKN